MAGYVIIVQGEINIGYSNEKNIKIKIYALKSINFDLWYEKAVLSRNWAQREI